MLQRLAVFVNLALKGLDDAPQYAKSRSLVSLIILSESLVDGLMSRLLPDSVISLSDVVDDLFYA